MEAGDTIRFGQGHLFVVVSDPHMDPNRVLIVNMTTDYGKQDQSCVLLPGDHPFVTHRTCMYYAGSRIESNRTLEWMISSATAKVCEPVSAEVLDRIRQGVAISDHASFEAKQILTEQGWTEP
jgi:hypothetical protein